MSDSPRTDAAELQVFAQAIGEYVNVIPAEFSRNLELELAQAEKDKLNLRAFIQELESVQQGTLNELDAANSKIDTISQYARHGPNCPSPTKPCDCGLNELLENNP